MRSPFDAFSLFLLSLPPQELSCQLETQGKVDSASLQDLVSVLAQQNLAAAEKPDLEQYESRLQAWEAEKRQLIQREKEMREKANQEKEERKAAKAAAQQAWSRSWTLVTDLSSEHVQKSCLYVGDDKYNCDLLHLVISLVTVVNGQLVFSYLINIVLF